MPKKNRSGRDLCDYFRDNPDRSLDYLLDHFEEFQDPDYPVKTDWTWEEIDDHSIQPWLPGHPNYVEPKPAADEPPASNQEQTRKTVIIQGNLCDVVDDGIKCIDRKTVFNQGGFLVQVVNTDGESMSIRELNSIGIADSISRNSDWKKWRKIPKKDDLELIDIDGPTERISKAIISRGQYPKISVILGVTECPFFRKSKTVCSNHGFDHESGFFLNFRGKIKQVGAIRKQDAEKALKILREPFAEFPFVNEESRMIPVALILSVIARPLLGNVPAFIFDASTRGSGKTLVADACNVILSGRVSPKFSWPEGRDPNIELEKTMNTIAMMGLPVVYFDNIPSKRDFGGAVIEKFVTSGGRIGFRELGGNKHKDLFFNTIITASGNNILDGIQDETRRRSLPCRMVPDCEKPEDRSGFKHSPLLRWVAKNRSLFLEAALYILRYAIDNPPAAFENWGSFEEFSALIPHAIIQAGGPNIMRTREMVDTSGGDENEAFAGLLAILERKFVGGFVAREVIVKAEADSAVKDALESVFAYGVPTSRSFGKTLRSRKDRLHNGLKITEMGVSGGAKKWNIVNTKQHVLPGTDPAPDSDY